MNPPRLYIVLLVLFMGCCIDAFSQSDSTRFDRPIPTATLLPAVEVPKVPEVRTPVLKIDSTASFRARKDSVLLEEKERLHQQLDSATKKQTLMKAVKGLVPHGTLALGGEYGFLPYTVNTPSPAYALNAEGQLQTNVLGLPLNVSFFYSSQKNLIGLTNYFRLSYDANRYKEAIDGKLTNRLLGCKQQLGRLQQERQSLMQKMAYTDYLSGIDPGKWPIDSAALKTEITPLNADSLGASPASLPAIAKPDLPDKSRLPSLSDTTGQAQRFRHRKDSVLQAYDRYHALYDSVKQVIAQVQKEVAEIQQLLEGDYKALAANSPYLSKVQNFLSGLRKLEIGLCYPNNSTFLANNIPLRGINLEYARNNRYFALSYGTTVSTLLYNTKTIDGFLQNARTAYNYFDFNNVTAGRKILSAKFGLGTKEGNHLFAGILLGKGLSSYLLTGNEDPATLSRESNVVLELDGRYKLGTHTILDMILGKSSVQGEDLSYTAIRQAMKEVFSGFRSYAALTRLSTELKPTKTKLSLTLRWVDPFFKSYGLGFMRSDNLRYELRMDQALGKRLRYTGMFRYEEDNLLRLMNYKNTFYSISNTLSLKLGRSLVLRGTYTPLIQTLRSENAHQRNHNFITTGVLTYAPKSRRTDMQFSLLYNYYLVNSDTQQVNFQNFAYSQQIRFHSGFRTGLNLSWFRNTLADTLNNNNVFLGVLDVGYQFENGSSVSVGGKSAYKWNGDFYPGFVAKGSVRLGAGLSWETQLEKYIVGDLFNGYDLERLKKFPYNCTTRLILNF